MAANAARDVGGRLAAMAIYGLQASGGRYAAVAALTNILAMVFGAMIYEIFLTDSDRGQDTITFFLPFKQIADKFGSFGKWPD